MSDTHVDLSFQQMYFDLAGLLREAPLVHPSLWQGYRVGEHPSFVTRELVGVHLLIPMPQKVEEMRATIRPDLPWADTHHGERASGRPLNPGTAYKDWPWHTADPDKFLDENGQFDISYMERISPPPTVWGIRFPYGNIATVARMLKEDPLTRRAVLPLYWPEDASATENRRSMCSLYYHWMMREGSLDCFYALRSCDFIRHFRNDIYLAMRMTDHLLNHYLIGSGDDEWEKVDLGRLHLQINSLHYHWGDEHHLPHPSKN